MALMQVVEEKGLPKSIRIDNGSELTSKLPHQWAYLNVGELDFVQLGKQADNALIESYNGSFREECLNESWFLSVEDAKEKIEKWRQHYRWGRLHGSLGNLPPVEFVVILGPK